jgi:hypothetical protein
LVSATTADEGAESRGSSTGGGGAKAGREAGPGDSVSLTRLDSVEAKREEKGGGLTDAELEADAWEGECGGGAA